ncbi:MAG: hypothetical protein WC389_17260 [Lutibacter sp.]
MKEGARTAFVKIIEEVYNQHYDPNKISAKLLRNEEDSLVYECATADNQHCGLVKVPKHPADLCIVTIDSTEYKCDCWEDDEEDEEEEDKGEDMTDDWK